MKFDERNPNKKSFVAVAMETKKGDLNFFGIPFIKRHDTL
jgi:hypothetical protein